MKRIVCPTDFSDVAQNAILYAANLCQLFGAKLTLLNVQAFDYLTAEDEYYKAETVEVVKEHLEKLAMKVSQAFQIPCVAEVQPSQQSLTEAISKRATHFDMIVMGTQGVKSLTEFFSGSQTYHVIRGSSVPLLLIPQECEFKKPKSMVYAFNYLNERKLPTDQLMPLVNATGVKLTVLDVMEEAYSHEATLELEALQHKLKMENKDIQHFSFDSIQAEDIAKSIDSYILRNEADVLALCAEHRSLIGGLFHDSVIKVVSSIADYPVYVFHR